ncbi:MAG: S9 family peptidase [Gemmatimonadaceae bacterium]
MALCGLPLPARAQLPASVDSSLHTIFASRTYAGERAAPARWRADGVHYTTLEPSAAISGGTDIVQYDAATGGRQVVVSAQLLRPSVSTAPLRIEGYDWSKDGHKLIVFTNGQRVWRQNTRGDFWVLDLGTSKLHRIDPDAEPGSLMFAKFSPDGLRVAYVHAGDLYVEPADGGTATRLTNDATRTLVNGMSDWVYEEEFGLRDGFRWSPDSRHIAFWQFDMSGVRDFTLINDTDSLYPVTKLIQYPKAGETNSAVRAGIVGVAGGPVVWAKLAGDPRQNYVPWMEWASPTDVAIQRMNRLQNHNDFVLADATTGDIKHVLTDQDTTWVNVVDDVPWLDGEKHFLWESERDGWRHLYLGSRDGGALKLVTPGEYDVLSLAGLDEPHGWVYIIASPKNATQRYLYRVSFRNPGAPVRITPASETGTNAYSISPTAQWAEHTFSTFDTPPVIDIVALPSHRSARTLVSNATLRAATAAMVQPPVEFFQVPVTDGATLDGWMIRPRNFDRSKKYPVLVQVYGEPAAQTVMDRWGGPGMLWHRMLADLGYIVVSFDNRGTPAPKGRAWRKVIYGAIGPIASREQADAVQSFARAHAYADSSRVAIWGWSGGGSSTLNAMFRFPDVYKVGMAVAPVADQHLYDSIYEERYVGLPSTNAHGYDVGSPINFAQGLKGKLLVVHGSGDDNVHYQGTERLVNRLVALDKPFDLMVYPNRSHCICEGTGTTLHVYSLLTRYLLTNMPPAKP